MSAAPYRGAAPKPSAVSWALRQSCGSPGEKLVLVAMADLSDASRECYPGARYLAEVTGQEEAAVRAAIDSLRGIGLIALTGRSKGPNGRGPIYKLAVDGPVEEWESPV